MARDPTRWDIVCRVVDNYGDAGVAFRLARMLAIEHGERVTLWIDDPARLSFNGLGCFLLKDTGRRNIGQRESRADDARILDPIPVGRYITFRCRYILRPENPNAGGVDNHVSGVVHDREPDGVQTIGKGCCVPGIN